MSDHPVSLKVMRVSRPALSAAWEPFYSTSPAFSSHSTATITSLQGAAPLPGYPKTLRDLSQPNEMLALPAAFGSIFLGETFESCLCVNNDSKVDIHSVSLRVEMQTATTKVMLGEFGGSDCILPVGGTLEDVVRSEMIELGQHVLACTVSCHLPNQAEPVLFRKFYKFAVTNPLSVKTKIHPVRSPTALLSVAEREKLFMQVHIQNLTSAPLWFERISFDCVDGWVVESVDNSVSDIFSGGAALMSPQDIRQYLYILEPSAVSSVPKNYPPGSVVPLGKMDIAWRTSFGEPGRLVTSTLTRRIPLLNPPPQPAPAPALPPHMKRTGSLSTSPRSQSPGPRSSTPPAVGSASPFRTPTVPPQQLSIQNVPKPQDLDLYLSVRHLDREGIVVNSPFSIDYTLTVRATAPGGRRTISLLVQQYQFTSFSPVIIQTPEVSVSPPGSFTPRLSSGYSTPSSHGVAYSVAHQKISSVSRRREAEFQDISLKDSSPNSATIPPPQVLRAKEGPVITSGMLLMGPSSFTLPVITLESEDTESGKHSVERDFSLHFFPTQEGFATVGGLRVLLLDDALVGGPIVLEDWKVIAEVVVGGSV